MLIRIIIGNLFFMLHIFIMRIWFEYLPSYTLYRRYIIYATLCVYMYNVHMHLIYVTYEPSLPIWRRYLFFKFWTCALHFSNSILTIINNHWQNWGIIIILVLHIEKVVQSWKLDIFMIIIIIKMHLYSASRISISDKEFNEALC